MVTIIDHRALSRDGLAKAIKDADAGYAVETFASFDDWLVDEDAPQRTSIIIISINAGSDAEDHAREIGALDCLRTHHPSIHVLALGDDEDPDLVVGALACGVQGYLSRGLSVSVVLGAIRLVQSGGVFVPAGSLLRLHQRRSTHPRDPTEEFLTAQQAKVAQKLLTGKANKAIAHELNIHESTVKVHVRNIMRKLQARNRTEVAFKLNTWLQLNRKRDLF
ncbi:response regulator transcription factor [Inquilinus sp. Marseille-Q2685]|uniref:response regulator transcription factor n=1 Tax=Inquilinus sp. Marseille-Q2685 TaxID=2866581 RepID=UPI001CE46A35|nr:response regulator transcription factor [Inquilinus sp. Marseille-Q2685]